MLFMFIKYLQVASNHRVTENPLNFPILRAFRGSVRVGGTRRGRPIPERGGQTRKGAIFNPIRKS